MCSEILKLVPDYWLAIVTTFLAVFTLWLVVVTRHLFEETRDGSKKQLGVKTWLYFIKRWDSRALRTKRKNSATDIRMAKVKSATDPILDFFEQVGTVYKNECIDRALVYSAFNHDAEHWWKALDSYVREMRLELRDPNTYEWFEYMVKHMRDSHPEDPVITDADVEKYILGEMEL